MVYFNLKLNSKLSNLKMEGTKELENIEALIKSLQITDSQTIIEQDEIQLIDWFIKEHASKYDLAKNC